MHRRLVHLVHLLLFPVRVVTLSAGGLSTRSSSMRDPEHPSEFDFVRLDEFERDPHGLTERLRETGRATVSTVNGEAAVVIQSAEAYRRLLERLDEAEATLGVQRGLASMRRGEGIPLDEAFQQIRESALKRRRTAGSSGSLSSRPLKPRSARSTSFSVKSIPPYADRWLLSLHQAIGTLRETPRRCSDRAAGQTCGRGDPAPPARGLPDSLRHRRARSPRPPRPAQLSSVPGVPSVHA
jgi:hypothetical protein